MCRSEVVGVWYLWGVGCSSVVRQVCSVRQDARCASSVTSSGRHIARPPMNISRIWGRHTTPYRITEHLTHTLLPQGTLLAHAIAVLEVSGSIMENRMGQKQFSLNNFEV